MLQSTPTVTVGQFDVVTPVNTRIVSTPVDTMTVSTPVDTMIVSTPVDTMIVSTPSEGCDTTVLSTPTSQRRVVQRTDSTQDDTPNHSHLRRKRGKVDDQCHHLVAEERQKVKLDVEKLHLEIKEIKMDCRLTRIVTYKETLLVRQLEQEMGLSPREIDSILRGSNVESDD